MELKELDKLVDELADAVRGELEHKYELASVESKCTAIKAGILLQADSDGLINGKNAEARKHQQSDILTRNQTVQMGEEVVLEWKRNLIEAQSWRAKIEARVSLTKAWLYSQAQIG